MISNHEPNDGKSIAELIAFTCIRFYSPFTVERNVLVQKRELKLMPGSTVHSGALDREEGGGVSMSLIKS